MIFEIGLDNGSHFSTGVRLLRHQSHLLYDINWSKHKTAVNSYSVS